MSRLEFHIAQKVAQRDAIDRAAERVAGLDGVVVEFGLGHGRSYSHLVARFPGREVFCFDRQDATPPGWAPPADHLYLGELDDVLRDPTLHERFTGRVVVAHLDLARGDALDSQVHHLVVGRTHGWLCRGGLVLSDRPLRLEPAWNLEPLGTGEESWPPDRPRFYSYRRRSA
jgi:hypothetical protein